MVTSELFFRKGPFIVIVYANMFGASNNRLFKSWQAEVQSNMTTGKLLKYEPRTSAWLLRSITRTITEEKVVQFKQGSLDGSRAPIS